MKKVYRATYKIDNNAGGIVTRTDLFEFLQDVPRDATEVHVLTVMSDHPLQNIKATFARLEEIEGLEAAIENFELDLENKNDEMIGIQKDLDISMARLKELAE